MSFKVSIIKKNQILTWCLILFLGIAGYINSRNDPESAYAQKVSNFYDENLGDAVFVNSENILMPSGEKEIVINLDKDDESAESKEFFAENRINRNNEYAKQIETFERIALSENTDSEQKSEATGEIKRINNEKNAIAIAENLIKLKGVDDVIILKNNNSVNVAVTSLKDENIMNDIKELVAKELDIPENNVQITEISKSK